MSIAIRWRQCWLVSGAEVGVKGLCKRYSGVGVRNEPIMLSLTPFDTHRSSELKSSCEANLYSLWTLGDDLLTFQYNFRYSDESSNFGQQKYQTFKKYCLSETFVSFIQ